MAGELAPLLLPQLFGAFATNYPDLHLDIGLTDRFVNLVREDYDVALRAGVPKQEDLIVRRLADLPMTVVASPTFLETWGDPKTAEALADLPFARFTMDGAVQPVRLADGTAFIPKGRIDCDTGAALIHAARSGLGAAYLLKCLATEELQTGALIAVAPHIALPTLPLNILHAFGRTVPARVKIFCDFIAIEARKLVGL
jgi:DNA-binding transcriptional LysR family regulator